ncbi:hypothetical protein TNCV_4406371 [Trichonephila clavipes]|nr:hypothetical protein TNCV_4406371 [Trichonephila clavipes]
MLLRSPLLFTRVNPTNDVLCLGLGTRLIFGIGLRQDNIRLSLGARAAGVHYRLFSVWTLVPVRLCKQLSGNSTVDEIASEAADCRLTYTRRIVLKGGKSTTVGRRGSAVGACVGHLLVCGVGGRLADYGPMGSNELRFKDRLIWAHQ